MTAQPDSAGKASRGVQPARHLRSADDVPRIAGRQGGVFTASQARVEGWTARQVKRRLEARRWVHVAGKAVAGRGAQAHPWTAFQLAFAAQLTVAGAVASHETAGLLHGFPLESLVGGWHEAQLDVRRVFRVETISPGVSHVITPTRHDSGRNIQVHRLRLAPEDFWHTSAGLRVTSPARTALDLLSTRPMTSGLDLWAWVSSRHILDVDDLAAALEQRRRWYGAATLRELLRLVEGGAVSGAEFRLHRLLREAGLTGWTAGVTISDALGIVGVVDLLFDLVRVIVEVDGWRAHSTRSSFVSDRRRQNRLVAAGYVVLRFTWDDLVHRPAAVIAEIKAAVSGGRK